MLSVSLARFRWTTTLRCLSSLFMGPTLTANMVEEINKNFNRKFLQPFFFFSNEIMNVILHGAASWGFPKHARDSKANICPGNQIVRTLPTCSILLPIISKQRGYEIWWCYPFVTMRLYRYHQRIGNIQKSLCICNLFSRPLNCKQEELLGFC